MGHNGDTERFVAWCHHHGPAVHAFLARRGGRQVADDLFGEVWLRAFSARGTYDERIGQPLPWLYGIARNVLRGHWRNRAVVGPTGPDLSDPFGDADDRLDAGHQAARLRQALRRLTEEEREVLLLVAWEHLTPTEIARVLDIPPGTARSRLHRARQLMREEMEPPAALNGRTTSTIREEHR
jgi:RNA polymerase sigma-70 factor (ECF subfamily)